MPTYTIQAPDGIEYSIEGPDGATREQVIAKIQERQAKMPPQTPTTKKELSPEIQHIAGGHSLLEAGVETALALGSGLGTSAVGGLAGLGTMAGNVLGLTDKDPSEVTKAVQSMAYQPKNEIAKAAQSGIATVAELANRGLGELAGLAGGASIDEVLQGGEGGENALQAIGETILPVLGAISLKAPLSEGAKTAALSTAEKYAPALKQNLEARIQAAQVSRNLQEGVQKLNVEKQAAQSLRAPVVALANKARALKFQIPPQELSGGQSGFLANTLRKVSGDQDLSVAASIANEKIGAKLISKDLEVPLGVPLTRELLDKLIASKGRIYQDIKEMPKTFKTNETYNAAVDHLVGEYTKTAENFPAAMGYPKIGDLQNELRVVEFAPSEAIELVKRLRERASKAYDAAQKGNLEASEMGSVFKKAANAVEDVISTNLKMRGDLSSYEKFVENRKFMAKAFDVKAALDPVTGALDSAVLGKFYVRGDPLTGALQDIGQLASEFPAYFTAPKKVFGKWAGKSSDTLFGAMRDTLQARPFASKILLSPDRA